MKELLQINNISFINLLDFVYWDSFVLWSMHWLFIFVYFYKGIKYIMQDTYYLFVVRLQNRNKNYYNFLIKLFKIYFFILNIFKKLFLYNFIKKLYLIFKLKYLKRKLNKKLKKIEKIEKFQRQVLKPIKKKYNNLLFLVKNIYIIHSLINIFNTLFAFIFKIFVSSIYFFKFIYFNIFGFFRFFIILFYWRRYFWQGILNSWFKFKYFIFKIFIVLPFTFLSKILNMYIFNFLFLSIIGVLLFIYNTFFRIIFIIIYIFYSYIFFIFFLRWVYRFMRFSWYVVQVSQATVLLIALIYLFCVIYILYPKFRKLWKQDRNDWLIFFFSLWLIIFWNAKWYTISWTTWIFQNILTYEDDYGYYVRTFFKNIHYKYKAGIYLQKWDQNIYLKYELWNYFIIRIIMLWFFRLWWWGFMFEVNEYRKFLKIFLYENHPWMVDHKVFPFFGPRDLGYVKESVWVRDTERSFEYLWFINTDRRSVIIIFDLLDYVWAKFEKPMNFKTYHYDDEFGEHKPFRRSNYWLRYRDLIEMQFPNNTFEEVEAALFWDIAKNGWKSLFWNPNLTWDYKIKKV